MKNKFSILLVLSVVVFVVVGCSSLTDRVEKSVMGDQKTASSNSNSGQPSSVDSSDDSRMRSGDQND